MTWLEIQAQDVWLFRNGRPFSSGEDRVAAGMFPPTPLTLQGALRQKISVSLGVSLRDYRQASRNKQAPDAAYQAVEYIGVHGAMEDMGLFKMAGPLLSYHNRPLLPVPADLFYNKDVKRFFFTSPKAQGFSSDLEDIQFLEVKEGYENLPQHWMSVEAFEKYLKAEAPAGNQLFGKKELYESENRVGVSTDAEKSAGEKGLLYQVEFVRPQEGVGLLVEVGEGIPAELLEGTVQLGGEARQAIAKIVDIELPKHAKFKQRFKVIFLTPTYFDGGWKPMQNEAWSEFFGAEVKLKSAALYRPLKIGGWSNASGKALPMHNYVAPGSVYYFEVNEGEPKLPSALTQNPENMDAARLGFGQYIVGQWS